MEEKIKILLVEDDPFMVDIYSTKLKEIGYSVFVALNGEEALEKVKENNPDLMLLDIVLPNMDGWEVLRRLKEDGKNQNLKVIVLSNLGQKPEIEKGLGLGAMKYIIKAHYTPSQVAAEVENILKEK
jgi:CheY-like chemotaxis protein